MMKPCRNDNPIGRLNAVKRRDLAKLWGMDDRQLRAAISRMRREPGDGFAILSSSTSPAGYWRSRDITEIQRYIRETRSRARNTLASMADAERVLRQAEERRDYGDAIMGR